MEYKIQVSSRYRCMVARVHSSTILMYRPTSPIAIIYQTHLQTSSIENFEFRMILMYMIKIFMYQELMQLDTLRRNHHHHTKKAEQLNQVVTSYFVRNGLSYHTCIHCVFFSQKLEICKIQNHYSSQEEESSPIINLIASLEIDDHNMFNSSRLGLAVSPHSVDQVSN